MTRLYNVPLFPPLDPLPLGYHIVSRFLQQQVKRKSAVSRGKLQSTATSTLGKILGYL